jgi:hypothetical protein
MEIDPSQFELLKKKALVQKWIRVKALEDYQHKQRFFMANR